MWCYHAWYIVVLSLNDRLLHAKLYLVIHALLPTHNHILCNRPTSMLYATC